MVVMYPEKSRDDIVTLAWKRYLRELQQRPIRTKVCPCRQHVWLLGYPQGLLMTIVRCVYAGLHSRSQLCALRRHSSEDQRGSLQRKTESRCPGALWLDVPRCVLSDAFTVPTSNSLMPRGYAYLPVLNRQAMMSFSSTCGMHCAGVGPRMGRPIGALLAKLHGARHAWAQGHGNATAEGTLSDPRCRGS